MATENLARLKETLAEHERMAVQVDASSGGFGKACSLRENSLSQESRDRLQNFLEHAKDTSFDVVDEVSAENEHSGESDHFISNVENRGEGAAVVNGEELEILVDSGAATSCLPKDALPDAPLALGETWNLKNPDGRELAHYGTKDIRLQAEDGNGDEAHVTSRYQSTDVRRAIKSVYETSQYGNLAIFYDDGGEFVHVGPKNMKKAKELVHEEHVI